MTTETKILRLVFPQQVFDWFDPVEGAKDGETVRIVFEEKHNPPEEYRNKNILSQGFTDITVNDFPLRGRKTLLTFRRRYWQAEGEPGVIKLVLPGTQLAQESAALLKAGG